jgi:DNA-binding NtrC family response regulator
VSREEGERATGQEVLVLDADRSVLQLLEEVLVEAGLTVTALGDPVRARDQVEKRFIPVVLCDLDISYTGGGLELVKFAREKSPLTSVILMTVRKGFDAVAPAFRSGATDVVSKTQDAIPYIRDRVLRAARELRAAEQRDKLVSDLAATHEQFLAQMMELSRQRTDLEDRLRSRDGTAPSLAGATALTDVLLVDDEQALGAALVRDLPADKGWRIRHAQRGGQALDAASQIPPDILVVSESLSDLPASMVIKSIKGRSPDVVALLFTPPGDTGRGDVRMVDGSKLVTLIPSFSSPEQMARQLEDVRDALVRNAKERRYMQLFRRQHFDFLQKYQSLRQRLGRSGA